MGATEDELRRDAQHHREQMGDTLEAIGDRLSPERIVERRKAAVGQRLRSVKEAVMGSPDYDEHGGNGGGLLGHARKRGLVRGRRGPDRDGTGTASSAGDRGPSPREPDRGRDRRVRARGAVCNCAAEVTNRATPRRRRPAAVAVGRTRAEGSRPRRRVGREGALGVRVSRKSRRRVRAQPIRYRNRPRDRSNT